MTGVRLVINRAQVENGRTYLRELAFGEAAEPHRATALAIVAETSEATMSTLVRIGVAERAAADELAALIEAGCSWPWRPSGPEAAVEETVEQIAQSVQFLVNHVRGDEESVGVDVS